MGSERERERERDMGSEKKRESVREISLTLLLAVLTHIGRFVAKIHSSWLVYIVRDSYRSHLHYS